MKLYQYRSSPQHDVGRGSEESPFWVSFSDMMTGMTSLFLVLACSALLLWIIEAEPQSGMPPHHDRSMNTAANASYGADRLAAYESNISTALQKVSALSRQHGFSVDAATDTIDLGHSALFPLGSDRLSVQQQASLRSYVADLIGLIHSDPAMAPLKSITVVGYTDPAGSYLFNLDLSARRSERLMCALLASSTEPGNAVDSATMTEGELQTIRHLFKVGGYSADAQKESAAASRRLALKLNFYKLDEPHRQASVLAMPIGSCALDSR